MRLGTTSSNESVKALNQKCEEIRQAYFEQINTLVKTVPVKVMMGDSTVTEQATFDPKRVSDFFSRTIQILKEWSVQDVSVSNNEDIRRIFTKFEIMEGNYLVSGHMSIQFHVLLYYRPDQRVIECQKELAGVVDSTKDKEKQISDDGDGIVLDRLKEVGFKDFDHQKLFEIFYENDKLREKIYAEIESSGGADFEKMSETKSQLLGELDSMLVETYQITPVLINDTGLVGGEEGCLCTLDLEFVKGGNREGMFDAKKIPDAVTRNIMKRLDEIHSAVRNNAVAE